MIIVCLYNPAEKPKIYNLIQKMNIRITQFYFFHKYYVLGQLYFSSKIHIVTETLFYGIFPHLASNYSFVYMISRRFYYMCSEMRVLLLLEQKLLQNKKMAADNFDAEYL